MSDTQIRQTIDADDGHVETHLAAEIGRSTSKRRSAAAQFSRVQMLVVSITFVALIAAAYFIRGPILYERTGDARVDGHILPVGAQISGQVQQVNVIEGQQVHAGDILVVMDQRAYSIAVLEGLANLAYAQNTAAGLYLNAAMTIASPYSGLDAAQTAAKNAAVEVEAVKHRAEADEAPLKQVQVDASQS